MCFLFRYYLNININIIIIIIIIVIIIIIIVIIIIIISIIISYLAIRQCAAWSSTWITHNFPERRKPRKQKETHIIIMETLTSEIKKQK